MGDGSPSTTTSKAPPQYKAHEINSLVAAGDTQQSSSRCFSLHQRLFSLPAKFLIQKICPLSGKCCGGAGRGRGQEEEEQGQEKEQEDEDEVEEDENVINSLATGFPKLILKKVECRKIPSSSCAECK